MDQTSLWTVDPAGAPRKLRRSPMASVEPGSMLAFAPFQGFIRGISVKAIPSWGQTEGGSFRGADAKST
jgi:hypothetical protein